MNTETGRIYDLDRLYPTREEKRAAERRANWLSDQVHIAEYASAQDELDEPAQRREFELALARGHAVPVSAAVVQQARVGQRELKRRKRRAARASRRANRA